MISKQVITPVQGFITSLVLGFVTFIFYWRSFSYGFVFDDYPTIVNYFHLKTASMWELFFSNSRWLSRVLHVLLARQWGVQPLPFRIAGFCLHIASGILIFWLLWLAFSRFASTSFFARNAYACATVTAGLFLLHPVQTQTVPYITQSGIEGLVVFFTMLVLLLFTLAVISRLVFVRFVCYAGALCAAVLATGTKEIIIVLPVLVMLFDWFLLARGRWDFFKPRVIVHAMLLLGMLAPLMKFRVIQPSVAATVRQVAVPLKNNRGNMLTQNRHQKITPYRYFISQFRVICHYLKIFFWPNNLSFDYEIKLAPAFWSLQVLVPLFFLLTLFFLMLLLFMANPASIAVFGLAWFFVALLPRASFFPSTELVCDYKTYLPSFGLMLILGSFLVFFCSSLFSFFVGKNVRYVGASFVAWSVLVMCGYASMRMHTPWASELLLWKNVIRHAPGKARAYNNYAIALWEGGNRRLAMSQLKKAIELDEFYGEPHVNLGLAYQKDRDYFQAFKHYKRAIEIGEGHPELFYNLATLYVVRGDTTAAIDSLTKSVKLRDHYGKAWLLLGKLYHDKDKHVEALHAYKKASESNYEGQDLLYAYGCSFFKQGKYDKAQEYFEKISPSYRETNFYLGSCWYQKKKYQKAADFFARTYKRDQQNFANCYNYGQALVNLGKYKEAGALFNVCMRYRRKEYPYAQLHYIRCMHGIGKKEKATQLLQKMIDKADSGAVKNDALQLIKRWKVA